VKVVEEAAASRRDVRAVVAVKWFFFRICILKGAGARKKGVESWLRD